MSVVGAVAGEPFPDESRGTACAPVRRPRRRSSRHRGVHVPVGRAGYRDVTVCGSQEKTPGALGAAVTRSHWVAVEPYVSSRVRLGTPA